MAAGETPFTLCFGVDVVIPSEIGHESLRRMAFIEQTNDQMMYEYLTLIDEIRAKAGTNTNSKWPDIIMLKLSLQQSEKGIWFSRKRK